MNKPSKADCLIYKALKKAIEKDQLRIYLDSARVNRPGSPVYDVWEALLPVLTPVIIGLILILAVSIVFGLSFIVGMILIYTTYFKKRVDRYLLERTKTYLTSSYQNLEKLWDFGGIVLADAADKKSGCIAPHGDWKEFVVRHFADYMTEKTDDNKQEKAADDTPTT